MEKILLFDLDGTLYSARTGLWNEIGNRIETYLSDILKFEPESIPHIRESYFQQYGTTLRGLQIHHQIDPRDYLDYCHNIDLSQYLAVDIDLKTMLAEISNPKYVFTNSDVNHANRVLDILGIRDHFIDIIDIHTLEYECKPMPEAYQRTFKIVDNPDPSNYLLIDDSLRNVEAAIQIGMDAVYVTDQTNQTNGIPSIALITELTTKYQELLAK